MSHSKPLPMAGETNQEGIQDTEAIVERYEGATRKLGGFPALLITVVAIGTSLFSLYAAPMTIVTQMLRGVFVMLALFLTILAYPAAQRYRNRIPWFDWALALLSVLPVVHMLYDFEEFIYRMVTPSALDMAMGLILIGVILEAIRRTAGTILMVIVFGFLLYACLGQYLPEPWTHRGYSVDRVIGRLYMTLEGIFGVPTDVAATFIILFTIYGAFLDRSGAGKFFIDFAFSAMGGKPTGAGRTALLASFLLGGPAGSGVAVTVTIGSASWPMLKKVGYSKESAGGFLAAGGLGAVLSPPVMGAAAFLICELLK
ncbi:MAG: TRAP transporter large permease subunit, partial [Proteobacteria bacterium]|nr:TRAP transporter large permease subunit [Pseudomonadota bacterium]